MAASVRILLIAESDPEAATLRQLAPAGADPTCVLVRDPAGRRAAREALARPGWDAVICSPAAAQAMDGAGAGDGALSASFEAGQRVVLEHIAEGRRLPELLEEIVLLIERQAGGMFCSILLLDKERGTVHHGAAPNLPRALVEGIDGAAIGPQAGSCGAAAYTRQPVIVEDIGTHPNWVPYKHLVLPAGLRACWSSPIFSGPGGDVLGTFAMYYREPRKPTAEEQIWVSRATHLAAIAISRDRAERAVRQADARYRQIVDTASEGVWLIDADARTLFVNDRTAHLLGHEPYELLGKRLVDFMDEPSRRAAEGSFIERLRTHREQRQFRFRRKDGSLFWALISGSPLQGEDRASVGALCMVTDITELKLTEQALRQSEAEFRVVFENAAIGMALAGRDGLIVRSNPALQHFLGFSESELASRPFWEFAHPDDVAADLEFHRRMTSGETESYQTEKRYRRKDGTVVWGRLTASVVRPAQGKPLYAIGMIENVTERRRMEEAVRSSERLRTLMYDAVTDILFYLGVEPGNRYRFLSVNAAFLAATGLKETDVVNKLVDEVIPLPSQELVFGHYARAIQERRTVTWDETSVYPAGVRYGEVSVTPIFGPDGVCTNLVGTVHDVTERRQAEERLATQAALLDKAKDAIIVRELDGLVHYWNAGAERLYGWSASEAVGRNVLDLIYTETGPFHEAEKRLVADGQWTGEIGQITKAGKPIIVEGSWTLLRDEQGRPRSLLAINSDITERKRLEAHIARAQRLEMLGTQAGGIAHDFNNLLMVMSEGLNLALSDIPKDHPARPALADVQRAAAHGAELTRQMLTFSRQREPYRQPIELQRAVGEALGLLRAAIPRNINVRTRLEGRGLHILGDATQVQQIVMNLGRNAAQAMPNGGTLEVAVDQLRLDNALPTVSGVLPPGDYVRLLVSDAGSGMDEATLERIFDPFFTTKAHGDGNGLGLSVVHGIVKGHGGGIVVRSTPGRGTEFALFFPAAERLPARPSNDVAPAM